MRDLFVVAHRFATASPLMATVRRSLHADKAPAKRRAPSPVVWFSPRSTSRSDLHCRNPTARISASAVLNPRSVHSLRRRRSLSSRSVSRPVNEESAAARYFAEPDGISWCNWKSRRDVNCARPCKREPSPSAESRQSMLTNLSGASFEIDSSISCRSAVSSSSLEAFDKESAVRQVSVDIDVPISRRTGQAAPMHSQEPMCSRCNSGIFARIFASSFSSDGRACDMSARNWRAEMGGVAAKVSNKSGEIHGPTRPKDCRGGLSSSHDHTPSCKSAGTIERRSRIGRPRPGRTRSWSSGGIL